VGYCTERLLCTGWIPPVEVDTKRYNDTLKAWKAIHPISRIGKKACSFIHRSSGISPFPLRNNMFLYNFDADLFLCFFKKNLIAFIYQRLCTAITKVLCKSFTVSARVTSYRIDRKRFSSERLISRARAWPPFRDRHGHHSETGGRSPCCRGHHSDGM